MTVVGFLDRPELRGTLAAGYPILGTDDELGSFLGQADAFLIAVGQIETADIRRRLFQRLVAAGANLPWVKAESATVHSTAVLGSGTIAMHRAFVNVKAVVGDNCILNTGSLLEHDVVVGNHVHVSTGAIVNGGCIVGDGCFLGSGSILRNNITLGENVILGAGAVVVNDLIQPGTYVGNPARLIT